MPLFGNLVSELTGQPTDVAQKKRQEVSRATDMIRSRLSNMPSKDQFYTVGAATTKDTGQAVQDETFQDLRQLNDLELMLKYGPEDGQRLVAGRAAGESAFSADRTAPVGFGEGVGNAASSVGLGLFNGVAGLGSLATGAVNKKAGAFTAEKIGQFNDYVRERQSDGLRTRLKANATLNQLDDLTHSTEEFNARVAGEGNLKPFLERVGKDAVSHAKRGIQDPAAALDGTAQGIGSLFAGGTISKGLRVVGEGVSLAASKAGMADAALAKAAEVGRKSSMTAAIGGLEAGGAYQQTTAEVRKMSHEQLLNGSETYRALVANGMSYEDARDEVANSAGLKAAAIQAPIGVLTGKFVSKFEGKPFASGSFREALASAGKEALEEGIQSGSGQLAQNYAIKSLANSEQDMAAGVGAQIGEGALYGSLTAGALQAPAATLNTAWSGAKLGGRIAKSAVTGAVDFVLSRGDKIINDINKASPVSMEAMATASQAAAQEAPQARADVEQAINESSPTPEASQETQGYLGNIFAAATFSNDEAEQQTPAIRDAVLDSGDRFEAMRRAAEIAKDTEQTDQNRVAAGFFLLDQVRNNSELMQSQLPDAIAKLPADSPALLRLKQYEDVLSNMAAHPEVKVAVQAAMQIENKVTADKISEEKLSTVKGQTDFRNAVSMAEHVPDQMDPEVAKQILTHATDGTLNRNGIILTPAQLNSVEAASQLAELNQKRQETADRFGLRSTVNAVSDQIRSDLSDHEFTYRSATQHTVGVLTAMSRGEIKLAQERMNQFHDFAQTMANKVQAGNEAALSGKSSKDNQTAYQAVDPNTGEWFQGKLWVDPKHWGSVNRAQQSSLDADVVVQMANNLSRKFPELGLGWVMPVALDLSLSKPVAEVARAARTAGRAAPIQKPTPVPLVQESRTPKAVIEEVSANPRGPVSEVPTQTKTPQPAEKPEAFQAVAKVESQPKAETKTVSESREAVPVATVTETFPSLVGGEKNRLIQGFKAPAQPRSRLASEPKPGQAVLKAITSDAAFLQFTGLEWVGNRLTAEVSKSYIELLKLANPALRTVIDRLDEVLTEQKTAKKDNPDKGVKRGDTLPTIEELLASGEEAFGYVRGRALNIVEVKTGDQFGYNDTLIQSAVLAGLHWAVNSQATARQYTEEDVAGFLNKDPMTVEDEELEFFNTGIPVADAKRSLASTIVSFWGLQKDPNAPLGFTEGVPEGVAAEVLYGLEAAGLLVLQTANIDTGDGSKKSFNRILMADSDKVKNILDGIKSFPDALAKAVVIDSASTNHIGQPPKEVARTQMRNRLVENTKQQLEAIKNEQSTPHFINRTVIDFYKALGREGVLSLLGGGELTDVQNKNHRKSLEGKNRTMGGAYDQLIAVMSELEAKASVAEKDPTEVPIYYEYNVSRVGRLHMMGKYNPQSNKLMREAILPTWSTMDLTNKADRDLFMLGVAQAWGVKVHKIKRADSLAKLNKLIAGDFAPAVQIFKDWLESGFELDADDIVVLKNAFGKDMSPMAIHAGLELARALTVSLDEQKAFKTAVYVEADGVTDGPINAMVHFATSIFSPTWLRTVAKGGLFVTSKNKTMNDHFISDPSDLYESTKDHLVGLLGDLQKKFSKDPKLAAQMQSMLRVMNVLLPDVEMNEDKELVIGRGVIKNPLTVTIYGSGANGIAAKITGAMLEKFYEQQTAILSSDKPAASVIFGDRPDAEEKFRQYLADLTALTEQVVEDRKTYFVVNNVSDKTNTRTGEGTDYTLTSDQVKNIQQNVLKMFVGPMQGAISNSIGDTAHATTSIQKAVDVQSIFLKYAFEREVKRALELKAKDPSWKRADFLSQAELDKIYTNLKHLSPLIETGTQTLFVAGSERSDVQTTEFSRSLTDDLSSPAFVYGPTQAGVSGIPFTTISTGDGQMMQNYSTDSKSKGHLLIFDGANFRLRTLEDDSRRMNAAVWQGWTGNPLGAVYDSYSSFLQDISFEKMGDKQRESLLISLFGMGTGKKIFQEKPVEEQVQEIMQGMNVLSNNLLRLKNQIQARHTVLSKLDLSIDHMASAESPYQHKGGISLDGMNDDAKVQIMNDMYVVELAALENKKAPERAFAKEFEGLGVADPTGVRVISSEEFRGVASTMQIPTEHRAMMLSALKSLRDKGWRIVLGSIESTGKFQLQNGLHVFDHSQSLDQIINGYAVMGDRTLYLHNATPETLLHELIHAATMEKVAAAYANPESLTSVDRDAVFRLEGLMSEWLAMGDDLSEMNADVRQTYANSVDAIQSALSDPQNTEAMRKAIALNEFMAWSLSNQRIIKIQNKTSVKSALFRIVGDALKVIRDLIWGSNKAPVPGDTLASNIRFNTAVLMEGQQPLYAKAIEAVLYHSAAYGQNARLIKLDEAFNQKIASLVNEEADPAEKLVKAARIDTGVAKAISVSHTFASAFPMTMQEKITFTSVVSAFMAMAELDANAMNLVSELHAYVTKSLTLSSFLTDPNTTDPNELYQAQQKFDAIMGTKGTAYDDLGRTALMPAFLALSQTNDEFRALLAKMEVPKRSKFVKGTVDQSLDSIGTVAMEQLSDIMGGAKRNSPNVQVAIDTLTNVLADTLDDRMSFKTQMDPIVEIGRKSADMVDTANDWLVNHMQTGVNYSIDRLQEVSDNSNNKVIKAAAAAVKLLASNLSIDRSKEVASSVISKMNETRVWKSISEVMVELVGRTEDNGSIYDMIKIVRSMVQQTRQRYREEVPKIIDGKFRRELTDVEKSDMFKGLGKTDLAGLQSAFTTVEILDMVRDTSLMAGHIARLSARLAANEPTRWTHLERKSKELAQFMVNGVVGGNLLRNTHAIAGLLGEPGFNPAIDQKLVKDLDQLVALYAYDLLPQSTKDSLSSLAQDEVEGMDFVLNYLVGQRKGELDKLVTEKALMNHYQGYIPSEQSGGASLIVAADTEGWSLLQKGFRPVGKYEGSLAEHGAPTMSYYFSPVSGRAAFSQGIMQNVHTTAAGIDPVTGLSYGPMTAGKITDQQSVQRIFKLRSRNEKATEPLMPIYDGQGKVVAYERSVLAGQLGRLDRNTNLSEMLGVWRGRQIEEALASRFNDELINKLYAMWKVEKGTRGNEYVDLLDKKALKEDPVLKDAVALFTPHVYEVIRNTFGSQFMVRRDLLNDVVGYRNASLGDAWTGVSRQSDEVNRNIQRAVVGVFGADAYKMAVQAERIYQQVMSDARTLIVVKSVIVPISNLISNIYQLSARGVPLTETLRLLPKKTAEIDRYVQNRMREIAIEAELRAATDNVVKTRKLNVELRTIKDANRRMTIWPLIEAGEFSSVSDGQIVGQDLALSQGRLLDYVEGLVAKVPKQLQTVAKYAWISKDTALYRGMTRVMQYGDFLAKAIQYDDLVKRKGKASKEALRVISDEYVNYDRLPGRGRSYLESMGLLWFWNYKLRITKVAMSTIRENPLQALISSLAPQPELFGTIGSPVQDNIFAITAEGKLMNSVGPGQGLHSLNLNPWVNLLH